MNPYLKQFKLTEDQLIRSINIQVMARRNPKRVTYPENWVPTTQLDRFVAQNLIMDMGIKEIMQLFPNFSVNMDGNG